MQKMQNIPQDTEQNTAPLQGPQPDNKPPQALVLLPGLLCDRALWEPVLQRWQPHLPVIVPDLRHHDTVAELAASFQSQLPERFALAGLSMGGYVALALCRHLGVAAHRALNLGEEEKEKPLWEFPKRITHLALINSSARADTAEQSQRRRMLISMAKAGEFKGVTPRLLPLLIHPARLQDVALTDTIMQMAARVGRDAFFMQQKAILSRPDARGDLPKIKCPTLVIGGDADALTPPEITREIAAHIPHAEYLLLPHCGHLSPLEQPELVSAAMQKWLNR